jgi:hypothetical protein
MSFHAEFLAVKALRDEIRRGGENEIYKMTVSNDRIAIDKAYARMAATIIQMTTSSEEFLQEDIRRRRDR